MIEWVKAIIVSPYLTLVAICLATFVFLFQLWVTEKFKAEIVRENNRLLEEIRWDFKAREQAAKVAEYMDLVRNLRENSPEGDYHRANTLAWELAMWLPSDIYKKLGMTVVRSDRQSTPFDVVIEVRKILLKDKAGDLTADHVIYHAPGIGKKMGAKQ
jgi:hypothetical protein